MYGLTEEELCILKPLNTPRKIQDFLEQIPINFEHEGDTCLSPREVLRQNRCHCIEGALVAALALRLNGHPPLLIDMKAASFDYDHVIAVFKENDHWGAITKTNHAVLRYRDPVYKTIRELVMSYFHEYYESNGRKALRSFSEPVDISIFDDRNWASAKGNLWYIASYIDKVKHYPIATRSQIAKLRKPDPLEMIATSVTNWRKTKTGAANNLEKAGKTLVNIDNSGTKVFSEEN